MDLVQTLTQSMGDYSPGTLKWINGIISSSTMSVGLYLVGILLVLDIVKMFEKANSSNAGIVTLKMFQGLAFRAALGGIMVALTSHIFQFCLLIGTGFANLIGKNANEAFDVISLPTVELSVDSISLIGDLMGAFMNPTAALKKSVMLLMLMIIGAIITLIVYVMVGVIVVLRFSQLYVSLAVMAIPMASFASEEHDQIGKGYIKKVLSYAFQPAVILIVIGVFHFLSKVTFDMSGWGNSLDLGLEAQFLKNLILAIVFIITIWQTHKKSSELFGV